MVFKINYIKKYFSNKEDLARLKRFSQEHIYITSKGIQEPVPYLNY